MVDFDDIIFYKRAFSDDDFLKAQPYFSQNKWQLQLSRRDFQSHKLFWFMDLSEESFFTDTLFNNVKNIIGDNFDVERVYANGQTYGQGGVPHYDDPREEAYTFLIYMNPEWDQLWGGDTVFLNRYVDKETVQERIFDGDFVLKTKKVTPSPNSAIFFRSSIVHYAESPTRDFYGIRISLAYKLIKRKS